MPPPPDIVVRDFLTALNKGDCNKALDGICESFVCPEYDFRDFILKQSLTVLDTDGKTAHVKVESEVRIKVGPVIVMKKWVPTLTVIKNSKWCITRQSLVETLADLGSTTE
jgi:hypothetical protein